MSEELKTDSNQPGSLPGGTAARNRSPSLKLNALSNLAVMGVGVVVVFFLTPAMLAHLGERRFGIWTLVSSIVGYFGLLQFGLTASVFYYIPHFRGKREPQRISAVISTSLGFYLLVGLAGFAVLQGGAAPLSGFFGGDQELTDLIRIIAVAFALELPSLVLNATIRGYEGFVLANVITGLTLLLRGILLIACIWGGYGLVMMGWALVCVRGIAILGYWIVFRLECPEAKVSIREVRWSELRSLLTFGGVILVATTANSLAVEAPKQIVGKLVSLEALGIFGVPLLVISYFRQFIFTTTRTLTPRISYFSGQGKNQDIKKLFIESSRYVAIIVAGLALLLWIAGPSFILLWTKRMQMQQAMGAFLVLVAGNFVYLTHRVTSDLLLGLGRKEALTGFEVLEGLAIVGLAISWTMQFGMIGAALGITVPFMLVRGILQPVWVCRIIGIGTGYYYRNCILKTWIIGIGLAAVGSWTKIGPSVQSWGRLFMVCALWLTAYVLLTYVFVVREQEKLYLKEQARLFWGRTMKFLSPHHMSS